MSEITEFVQFDEESGLKVSTQAEIFQSLKNIAYSSFGADFVISEGCEMFTFLDLLATSLSQSAGAYKKVYDSIGFVSATGITLDNAVALAGIVRTGLVRSSVAITLTRTTSSDELTILSPVRIQDINGNSWYHDSDIVFEVDEDEKIITFYASDGNTAPSYNISITAYNGTGSEETATSWKPLTVIPSNVTIQNKNNSILGEEKESDTHLKYRYYAALHQNSTATVDGLKSKILNANSLDLTDIGVGKLNTPIKSVYIYQNTTEAKDEYEVPAHSIWVVVDGLSDDEDNINIAKIIKFFKSLGVGTSYGKSKDNYAIKIKLDDEAINFSRVEPVECKISLNVDYSISDATEISNLNNKIAKKVNEYISNLGIRNDVLFTGIASAIYELYPALNYSDYVFDITTITINDSTRQKIDFWQYAECTQVTINGSIINFTSTDTEDSSNVSTRDLVTDDLEDTTGSDRNNISSY